MASEAKLSALRLLILSPCHSQSFDSSNSNDNTTPSPFPPLLEALTSATPANDLGSFAGYTSHEPLRLKTRYYERDVGIWCDELPPVSIPKSQSRSGASAADTAPNVSQTEAPPPPPASSSTPPAPGVPPPEIPPSSPTKPTPSPPTTSTAAASSSNNAPANPSQSLRQDDLPPPSTLKTWKTQFLSPVAAEVLASIGAIILILPIPDSPSYPSTPAEKVGLMEYMSAVNEVKDAIEDLGRDVGTLFLLQPAMPRGDGKTGAAAGETRKALARLEGLAEKFEDKCHEMGVFGWDFVWWDGVPELAAIGSGMPKVEVEEHISKESDGINKKAETVRNEYGEKLGIERVREVLEGVDWSISPLLAANQGEDDGDNIENDGGDDKLDVLGGDKYQGLDADLQREMMGLKLSMMDSQGSKTDASAEQEGEDMSIDQMSSLMQRVIAIREASADLDKSDREDFAKREVEKIMHEMAPISKEYI